MSIKTQIDVGAAFAGREAKPDRAPGDVPERIRKDAPAPVLRPDGSWKARADAIDQAVHENRDAVKAKNEWAARLKPGHRRGHGMGMGHKRSSDS